MSEDGERAGGRAATGADGRRPYEKPGVSWEQPLEVQPSLMASCAKLPGVDDSCNAAPYS